jgi:hypothetical protein
MQTHLKLSQVAPKAIEVSIKSQTSIDYSLKLFEVSGDSLPETLRERQQIALLQGFNHNQATFDRLNSQIMALFSNSALQNDRRLNVQSEQTTSGHQVLLPRGVLMPSTNHLQPRRLQF